MLQRKAWLVLPLKARQVLLWRSILKPTLLPATIVFKPWLERLPKLALKADGDTAKLLAADYPGHSGSVEDYVKEMVGTIGENMNRSPDSDGLQLIKVSLAVTCHNKVARRSW